MKTRHKSQDPLRKLSSSRISSKKSHKFSLSQNQTSSLFGPKKNVVVTYSKSRPIQVVKKNHFHTPDTPQVLTPVELQTTEGKQGRETTSKKSNPASQGGSYVSGRTLLSLEGSSLQMSNKLVTPFESTKHPSNSSMKSIRQGSSLALRNISNIPIEKTLSRTHCTPNRNEVQRIYQDKDPKSLSRKPTKKTPISWMRRKELIKKTKECKKSIEDGKEQENHHQEKGKQKKTLKSSSTNDKTCSVQYNATNYSSKSMSSCTDASSRGASKQGHTGTFTVQSMSLCSSTLTNDVNIEHKPVAMESVDEETLLPKNSTFNESGEHVMVQEFFSNHLSPIKDEDGSIKKPTSPPVQQEKLQKKDTSFCSDKLGKYLNQDVEAQTNSHVSHHQNINSSNTGNGPKTSTPTDQDKLPATLQVDVSPILEASDGKKENLKENIDTCEDGEAQTNSHVSHHQDINSSNTGNGPKTSTPTDQDKLPATLQVDVSPILEASDGKKENLKENIDTCEDGEAQTNSHVSHHQDINSSNTGNGPKTSTPTDQDKLPATLQVDVSPILEASDGKKENLKKHIDVREKTGVRRCTGKVSERNSTTRCGRDKSVSLDHKTKPENHRTAKTMQSQVQGLKENSKTSLPLQASICIEDDSDPEQHQDNITPEMTEPNKSCPSSSKRKLDYGSSLNRYDVNVCFLLDLKCTRKRPCKLWMRTESPCVTESKEGGMCVPQDVLTII